jgi:hypothetical protein
MFVADGPPSDEEAHRWQNAVDQNQRASLQAAGWQFRLQNDLVAEFSDGVRQFDCRTLPKGVRTPPKGVRTPPKGVDGTPPDGASCTPPNGGTGHLRNGVRLHTTDVATERRAYAASDRSPRCPGYSTSATPRVFRDKILTAAGKAFLDMLGCSPNSRRICARSASLRVSPLRRRTADRRLWHALRA